MKHRYDDRGVFVIGSQRSGTTLFRMMLNAHPDICSGEETLFLIDFQKVLREHWPHIESFGVDIEIVKLMIKDFFLKFHHAYCASSGSKIWVDKTPPYIFCAPFLNELFPEAKYIHIIRDGRDVAASFREKWGRKGYFRALWHWPACIQRRQLLKEMLGHERYIEIRYEDIVNNSEQTMRSVLSFLDLSWEPSVLEHWKRKHNTRVGFGSERPLKKVTATSISWRKRLSWWEATMVSFGFRFRLKELGYINGTCFDSELKKERFVSSIGLLCQKWLSWRSRRHNKYIG